jgi:signal transduction histidine kinase
MKWRLIVAFTGLLTMVLLAQDIPLTSYLRGVEKERLLSGLERDAFILSGQSENVLTGETNVTNGLDLQATIKQYANRDGARVVITDSRGSIVLATDPTDKPGDDFLSNRPEIATALTGQPTTGQRESKTAGETLLYVAVPVLSGADIVGAVRITYPASVIDDRTAEKAKGLLAVFGISVIGAIFAALFMANTVTSPLRRLKRSTESLANGDFSARAATNEGPPEIKSLAKSFNAMAEQTERLIERQRAFAGDASHQLRTPLTALRLQLERGSALIDDDPAAARERIEAAGAETERLQRLVEGLLMIARSEGAAPATQRTDLGMLTSERAEVWTPLAEERNISLTTRTTAGLFGQAVQNSVEQIIDNFIDNALSVSEPGTTIVVSAQRIDNRIIINVIDEGPGMSAEHLGRAFDRFWRAPDAPHGGSGIGLAVVQHLAELSGATVGLRNRTDRQGLVAILSVPVA